MLFTLSSSPQENIARTFFVRFSRKYFTHRLVTLYNVVFNDLISPGDHCKNIILVGLIIEYRDQTYRLDCYIAQCCLLCPHLQGEHCKKIISVELNMRINFTDRLVK